MDIITSIRETVFVPIHPAAWPLVAVFALVGIILTLIWDPMFFPALVLTLWCVYFFRNPARTTPEGNDLVIAPADGRIVEVTDINPPEELELPKAKKYIRIAIFMNVFDVHVNRAPVTGKVIDKFYFPGAFFSANLDKAAEENERMGLVIENDSGRKIGCMQIAGMVARRIICEADEGDELKAGEEYGIIRFGSRVDVYLPKPVKPVVLAGQRTIAGETILAYYGRGVPAQTTDTEKPRTEVPA